MRCGKCPKFDTCTLASWQCDIKDNEPQEQTNDEWLHTLPMEEMADEIISHIAHEIGLARYYNDDDVKEFAEWLKEKHDDLS